MCTTYEKPAIRFTVNDPCLSIHVHKVITWIDRPVWLKRDNASAQLRSEYLLCLFQVFSCGFFDWATGFLCIENCLFEFFNDHLWLTLYMYPYIYTDKLRDLSIYLHVFQHILSKYLFKRLFTYLKSWRHFISGDIFSFFAKFNVALTMSPSKPLKKEYCIKTCMEQ